MKRVVVGIIGSGFAADLHACAYQKVYGVEVVLKAVASLAPNAGEFAAAHGIADADLHDLRVGVLRFLHYLVDSLSDDAEPEQADFDFAHMLLVY